MTNRAFMVLLKELMDKEVALLEKKAQDYSREQERMHSFNRIANFINMKPPLIAFVLMAKHLTALQDWLNNYNKDRIDGLTIEEFRKIEEWIMDIRNYLALIYAMLYECIEVDE